MAIFLRKLQKKPKRILVSRTDRIGDFILTLPVFETLKKELDLFLTVLCNKSAVPLLENNPFVDDVITISQNEDPTSTITTINAQNFDTLLVMVNDPLIIKLLPSVQRIPVRIGPLNKPSVLFRYSHPVIQKRSRSIMNEAEYNLELLQIFGITQLSAIKPRLYLSNEEIQAFQSKFQDLFPFESNEIPIIVLHPGMGGSALNLKFDLYRKILFELLKKNYFVALTGSDNKEYSENKRLIQAQDMAVKSKVANVAGRFTLRELSILISLARLYIGPSTGPTHLANAVQTPLITFYPPIQVQSATRWQPYLAKSSVLTPQVSCNQKYRCIGEKCSSYYCMDSIGINDVLSSLKELLS
ncbi:glycosyltransferase family 9 protein [bacterium]|nr:glycosyltransferase family 9 protein [bacterium]